MNNPVNAFDPNGKDGILTKNGNTITLHLNVYHNPENLRAPSISGAVDGNMVLRSSLQDIREAFQSLSKDKDLAGYKFEVNINTIVVAETDNASIEGIARLDEGGIAFTQLINSGTKGEADAVGGNRAGIDLGNFGNRVFGHRNTILARQSNQSPVITATHEILHTMGLMDRPHDDDRTDEQKKSYYLSWLSPHISNDIMSYDRTRTNNPKSALKRIIIGSGILNDNITEVHLNRKVEKSIEEENQ